MNNSVVEDLCQHGRAAIQQRDHAAAQEAFEKAVAADPDCADGYEGLATVAFLDGDCAEAVKHYTKLTLLRPMEGRYYTNLGAIYNRMGEYQKAADTLRKAIQRDKKCAESFYNLGIAQRKLKQNAMAVSAYKEAIKLNPSMPEAYQNLGNTYVEMGNLQMAIANFKKALEIKPNFEKARAGLEYAEAQLQQAKQSVNPFGRLVDVASSSAKRAVNEGRQLREEERVEDRQFLKQLTEEVEHLAKSCVEFLKQKLSPSLLNLERAIAQSAESAFTLPEASEAFQACTHQWAALRKNLKRKILELRAHEEFMNTPDV